MPTTPTLHHRPDRTATHRPPPWTAPRDPVAFAAALYPSDTAAAQAVLARAAVDILNACGLPARLGSYGDHGTADAALPGGRLVLVPLAGLADLDAQCADEDDADPAVWHVMARTASGLLLEGATEATGCPSVLLALRAGIDPACAPGLVAVALGDPEVLGLLAAEGLL